jgi:hypothetical protein
LHRYDFRDFICIACLGGKVNNLYWQMISDCNYRHKLPSLTPGLVQKNNKFRRVQVTCKYFVFPLLHRTSMALITELDRLRAPDHRAAPARCGAFAYGRSIVPGDAGGAWERETLIQSCGQSGVADCHVPKPPCEPVREAGADNILSRLPSALIAAFRNAVPARCGGAFALGANG